MSVKVLKRVSKLPSSTPMARDIGSSSASFSLPALRGSRKSAGGETTFDNIREFFVMNAPDVDPVTVAQIIGQLKGPALIVVGVAAAIAIIYLVYKVWTNREPIKKAVSEMYEDIKSVAPDLSAIPGWADAIKAAIGEAFSAGSPSAIVKKLIDLKASVIKHQETINPANVGSGLLPLPGQHGRGYGLKVPI